MHFFQNSPFYKGGETMENKILRKFLLTFFIVMSFSGILFAWTANTDLLENNFLTLEIVPYRGIRISDVNVDREIKGLQITGMVKNQSVIPLSFGYIDVTIVNPDGVVLKKVSTDYLPRILFNRHRHPEGSYFNVSLPFTPPEGSKVVINYQRRTGEKGETFKCGINNIISGVEKS